MTPAAAHRLRNDWLPSLLGGLFQAATPITGFYLTVYMQEQLHFSGAQIGLLFGVQALTGLFAALPAGLGNDRLTSRVLLGITLVAQAVGYALLASLGEFWPYVGAFFLWSLANAAFKLSLDVQVLKTDSGTEGGRRFGLYQAFRFGGLTVGSIATGHLLVGSDFATTLWLVGAACLALLVFTPGLVPTPVGDVPLAQYRGDFGNRRALLFAVWMFLFALHWGAETTSYGPFLRHNLGLDLAQMGYYMAAEYAAIVLAALIWGRRIRSLSATYGAAIGGLITSGLGHIGMVVPDLAVSVAFRALHGLGDGLMLLVFYTGIAQLFAVERRGGNTGFVQAATMLGFVVGSLVYGPLGEAAGYALPLWTSGAITLGLAAPLIFARPKRSPAAQTAAAVAVVLRSR